MCIDAVEAVSVFDSIDKRKAAKARSLSRGVAAGALNSEAVAATIAAAKTGKELLEADEVEDSFVVAALIATDFSNVSPLIARTNEPKPDPDPSFAEPAIGIVILFSSVTADTFV